MINRIIYFLFIIGLIIATAISITLNLSTNKEKYEKSQFIVPNLPSKNNDQLKIDDKFDHVFTFIQISDLHISQFYDLSRKDDLKIFCTKVIDLIKPKVVLATGDITDARTPFANTNQIEQEWIWYSEVLNSTKVTEKTVWLDMRGNHDNFNVHNWNSSNNYYRIYSNYGKHSERHYHYNIKDGKDLYTFIGVDSCVSPGVKKFNFMGMLDHHDIDYLKDIRDAAIRNGTNFTVFFGHYPTSSITMPSFNLRNIMSGPYLCGHFHTIFNLVTEMYASHDDGSLELELGDFKSNRLFRVVAIDHGLFSFVDVKLNEYPIILLTNPKDSRFNMPGYEPLHRIEQSTYIRVLIYSIAEIDSVQVQIDNGSYTNMELKSNNLYVKNWNPSIYKTGLHKITIKAKDKLNNERLITRSFSLDNSRDDFSLKSSFMLKISKIFFGVCVYLISLLISLSPILIAFYLCYFNKRAMLKLKSENSFFYRTLYKLYLLGSIKKISFILFAMPVYLGIGPLYIGSVVTGHIGIGFAWGILVDGVLLPTAIKYVAASLSIIFFHLPITLILAHTIYCNYIKIEQGILNETFLTKFCHLRHFIFLLIVLLNFSFNFLLFYAYDYYTIIFGFTSTHFLIIYLILFYWTFNLNQNLSPKRSKFKNLKSKDKSCD